METWKQILKVNWFQPVIQNVKYYSIFITAWGCHIEQLIRLNLSTYPFEWIPFVNKKVPDV
jgi:hypothetical protein